MYELITREMNTILSEGWTDGIAVSWGTSSIHHLLYKGYVSGTEKTPI